MREYTLSCCECQKEFSVTALKWKTSRYKQRKTNKKFYCSSECRYKGKGISEPVLVSCKHCEKEFLKKFCNFKRSLAHFCSNSCSAKYGNAHKTYGKSRSKLEIWLEDQLKLLYPNFEFHFNRKDAINGELDIYLPVLSLAFELNGIFHYEPIFGKEKLERTQNNDNRKFQACIEKGIELCIIDSTGLKYFKPANAQKYLDIITGIINQKMVGAEGPAPSSLAAAPFKDAVFAFHHAPI